MLPPGSDEWVRRLLRREGITHQRTLKKEAENFAGFSPEVAWVSESGSSKMDMPELVTFNIPENAPVCTIPYNIEIENSQGRYASGSIRLTVKAR